jgi:hypothetical protein
VEWLCIVLKIIRASESIRCGILNFIENLIGSQASRTVKAEMQPIRVRHDGDEWKRPTHAFSYGAPLAEGNQETWEKIYNASPPFDEPIDQRMRLGKGHVCPISLR